jgi:hypothetical protein
MHGSHLCSSCPCNGLTQDELAGIRQRNGHLCACRLSQEEIEFRARHGISKQWLFDDPSEEIVITELAQKEDSSGLLCTVPPPSHRKLVLI